MSFFHLSFQLLTALVTVTWTVWTSASMIMSSGTCLVLDRRRVTMVSRSTETTSSLTARTKTLTSSSPDKHSVRLWNQTTWVCKQNHDTSFFYFIFYSTTSQTFSGAEWYTLLYTLAVYWILLSASQQQVKLVTLNNEFAKIGKAIHERQLTVSCSLNHI